VYDLTLLTTIFLEELRRLDVDDVKNSEYIEEVVIRRYS
jgi:hypothetical protein